MKLMTSYEAILVLLLVIWAYLFGVLIGIIAFALPIKELALKELKKTYVELKKHEERKQNKRKKS